MTINNDSPWPKGLVVKLIETGEVRIVLDDKTFDTTGFYTKTVSTRPINWEYEWDINQQDYVRYIDNYYRKDLDIAPRTEQILYGS